MNHPPNWLAEFQQTAEDLLHDIILLEALSLAAEHPGGLLARLPPEESRLVFHRLLDYLSQHCMDLYVLRRRLGAG